jgi:type IV secretion system protein VirB5
MFNTHITRARARALGLVLVLGGGQAAASGIPVVDVAGLAQAVAQYTTLGEQLATLKQQYDAAVEQLNTLKAQADDIKNMYDSFQGISGHANMLPGAVAQLHSFLPASLGDLGQLTGLVGQLRAAKEKFTAQALFPAANQADEREQYTAASDFAFEYKAMAKAAYDKVADRRASLESLGAAGTTANTPSAKLDLIAKGNSEIVLLLNDIAQLLAAQMGATADKAILDLNQLSTAANDATRGAQ